MKFAYSTLATIALLFSMPALAADLAEKGAPKAPEKVAPTEPNQPPRVDTLTFEIEKLQGRAPLCFTGG